MNVLGLFRDFYKRIKIRYKNGEEARQGANGQNLSRSFVQRMLSNNNKVPVCADV